MHRRSLRRTMVNTSLSQSQMEQLSCPEEFMGIRKSTSKRVQPERGGDDLRGESDREARNDFWSIEGDYI